MPKSTGSHSVKAKKPFPVHLDKGHHRIIEAYAERYGVSKGEAVRRMINSYRIEVIAPPGAISEEPESAAAH